MSYKRNGVEHVFIVDVKLKQSHINRICISGKMTEKVIDS